MPFRTRRRKRRGLFGDEPPVKVLETHDSNQIDPKLLQRVIEKPTLKTLTPPVIAHLHQVMGNQQVNRLIQLARANSAAAEDQSGGQQMIQRDSMTAVSDLPSEETISSIIATMGLEQEMLDDLFSPKELEELLSEFDGQGDEIAENVSYAQQQLKERTDQQYNPYIRPRKRKRKGKPGRLKGKARNVLTYHAMALNSKSMLDIIKEGATIQNDMKDADNTDDETLGKVAERMEKVAEEAVKLKINRVLPVDLLEQQALEAMVKFRQMAAFKTLSEGGDSRENAALVGAYCYQKTRISFLIRLVHAMLTLAQLISRAIIHLLSFRPGVVMQGGALALKIVDESKKLGQRLENLANTT